MVAEGIGQSGQGDVGMGVVWAECEFFAPALSYFYDRRPRSLPSVGRSGGGLGRVFAEGEGILSSSTRGEMLGCV